MAKTPSGGNGLLAGNGVYVYENVRGYAEIGIRLDQKLKASLADPSKTRLDQLVKIPPAHDVIDEWRVIILER